jgi:hypothetical protein
MLGAFLCKLEATTSINPGLILFPKEARISSLFVRRHARPETLDAA